MPKRARPPEVLAREGEVREFLKRWVDEFEKWEEGYRFTFKRPTVDPTAVAVQSFCLSSKFKVDLSTFCKLVGIEEVQWRQWLTGEIPMLGRDELSRIAHTMAGLLDGVLPPGQRPASVTAQARVGRSALDAILQCLLAYSGYSYKNRTWRLCFQLPIETSLAYGRLRHTLPEMDRRFPLRVGWFDSEPLQIGERAFGYPKNFGQTLIHDVCGLMDKSDYLLGQSEQTVLPCLQRELLTRRVDMSMPLLMPPVNLTNYIWSKPLSRLRVDPVVLVPAPQAQRVLRDLDQSQVSLLIPSDSPIKTLASVFLPNAETESVSWDCPRDVTLEGGVRLLSHLLEHVQQHPLDFDNKVRVVLADKARAQLARKGKEAAFQIVTLRVPDAVRLKFAFALPPNEPHFLQMLNAAIDMINGPYMNMLIAAYEQELRSFGIDVVDA